MPVPHPRSRMEVPGPASPLSRADSTMEDVKCTDVGYCSSSIFGLGNTRFGKEERHDSRCFSFMLDRNDLNNMDDEEVWFVNNNTYRTIAAN